PVHFLVHCADPRHLPHLVCPASYAHPPHPDPHSFPTRRSSDLLLLAWLVARTDLPARRVVAALAPVPLLVSPLFTGASAATTRRDRKSTRLNSSHQISSYAVFCLKKKKYPPSTTVRPTSQADRR